MRIVLGTVRNTLRHRKRRLQHGVGELSTLQFPAQCLIDAASNKLAVAFGMVSNIFNTAYFFMGEVSNPKYLTSCQTDQHQVSDFAGIYPIDNECFVVGRAPDNEDNHDLFQDYGLQSQLSTHVPG